MMIPSWVFSLGVHVVLLILMGQSLWQPSRFGSPHGRNDGTLGIIAESWNEDDTGLPGKGNGQPAGPGSGIYVGGNSHPASDSEGDTAEDTTADTSPPGRATTDVRRAAPQPDPVEAPPVELDLPAAPQVTAARIGPTRLPSASRVSRPASQTTTRSSASGGGARGSGSGTGEGDGVQGGGGLGGKNGTRGGNGKGNGGGGTSFFGHNADGRRFVYVLDASGSMYDYNAIAVAKAELLSSLSQLDENQQFQVIFYNERCYPMSIHGRKDEMFWGTEVNRQLASQFIRNVDPDGGTRHLDALLLALGYAPDVIFFLTDAGEPYLYAADLDKIRRRNNGRTTIFTVEFGKGGSLRTDNHLKKLARENGGAHTYRDVQQFLKN